MIKLAVPLMVLALAACGGQEEGAGPMASGEGAAAPATDSGGALEQAADVAAGAVALAPEVKSCLDLVEKTRFAEALPVCLEAVKQHPESADAKAALEQAQQHAGEAQALQAAPESLKEAMPDREADPGPLKGIND